MSFGLVSRHPQLPASRTRLWKLHPSTEQGRTPLLPAERGSCPQDLLLLLELLWRNEDGDSPGRRVLQGCAARGLAPLRYGAPLQPQGRLTPRARPPRRQQSEGLPVFQLGSPSSAARVCLTPEERWQLSFAGNKTAARTSRTPARGGSAPGLSAGGVPSPGVLCAHGFYRPASGFCTSTTLPTAFHYPQ